MNQRIRLQLEEHYRNLKAQDALEEKRRLDEVMQNDEALATLITARHQMVLDATKSMFLSARGEDIQAQMVAYNAKIKARLKADGYPENYLEPVRACPLCDDTGLVGEVVKTPCACYKRLALSMSDTVSNDEQTFERFDENVFPAFKGEGMQVSQRELMHVIKVFCEQYANDFPHQSPRDLLLYGASGLGKTYLLSSIAKRVRERGHEALSVTAFDAIRQLKNAFFNASSEADELLRVPLLLLDDLGMEPLFENITVEQIFNLINERQKKGLSTVISTNLSPSEIKARYTERVSSRLLDTALVRPLMLMGKDVRLLKR